MGFATDFLVCAMNWRGPVRGFCQGLFTWLPIGLTVNNVVLGFAHVDGKSMHPVLNKTGKEVVLLDKFSIYFRHEYNRGDVVTLEAPDAPGQFLVKRLIAIEGDWVKDRMGNLVYIPQGRCWIEGDNASCSDDSTDFGPVPLALIKSRVVGVVWPLQNIRSIARSVPSNRINSF